jgi:rhamnosyltransferase
MKIPTQFLGQSGWKIEFPNTTIYIDPYLSNSVQELDAPSLDRLRPIPFPPEAITDADYVLITHDHLDHCDPHTIPKLALASPKSKFIGPHTVINILQSWGIDEKRLIHSQEYWSVLGDSDIQIRAVPAAHLEIMRNADGKLACVGYLIKYLNKKIYFAGDTILKDEIIENLKIEAPIHIAVLPVNEHNYYRAKQGIVGNMSIREACQFAIDIHAKHLVPVHWDMFACNSVLREEIELIHASLYPSISLQIDPRYFNLAEIDISIIIRTLNESKHIKNLLQMICSQELHGLKTEVIVVDSGSTDNTVEIAAEYDCHIEKIAKSDFSFGRSLNIGCSVAVGDILVMVSGHCLPVETDWLISLCQPIIDGRASYCYGRQIGVATTYLSERQIFSKYFPMGSKIPQDGYFCNNANSALDRTIWASYPFDEELTGLEDLELAQRIYRAGEKIAYVSEAVVFHIHNETWQQVRRRFEREAIALQTIKPQFHLFGIDILRYTLTSICMDLKCSINEGVFFSSWKNIFLYRINQFWGAWNGNVEHRKLSRREKEKFYFPE